MLPRAARAKLTMEWRDQFAAEPESLYLSNQRYGEARRAIGLTQEDVAEILDVSRNAVALWEVGFLVPSSRNLLRLSKLYGKSVEELTGY